jgi:hypothetical protein
VIALDFLHNKLLLSEQDRDMIARAKTPLAACVRASYKLKEAIRDRDENALFIPLFDRGAIAMQNVDRALKEGRALVVEPYEFDTFFINDRAKLPVKRVYLARSDSVLATTDRLQTKAFDFFAQNGIAPYIGARRTLPNTLLIRLRGIKARTLVQALKIDEIAITNGEGCSLDLFTPSFIVQSYGFSEDEAREAISLSWAADTDENALLNALKTLLFRYLQIRRLD